MERWNVLKDLKLKEGQKKQGKRPLLIINFQALILTPPPMKGKFFQAVLRCP